MWLLGSRERRRPYLVTSSSFWSVEQGEKEGEERAAGWMWLGVTFRGQFDALTHSIDQYRVPRII